MFISKLQKLFEPDPNQKNIPIEQKKAWNDPQKKKKFKMPESYQSVWENLKTFLNPTSTPKISGLIPKRLKMTPQK